MLRALARPQLKRDALGAHRQVPDRTVTVIAAMLAASCGSSRPGLTPAPRSSSAPAPATGLRYPDSTQTRLPTLSRLWVVYGGETGPFCLLLRDDASGVFYGDFVTHNPIRWTYDSISERLDLTLSNLSSEDYVVLKNNVVRGHVLGFDSVSATITYMVDPIRPRLNVFGLVLQPAASLQDWQRPLAAEGCPPLKAAGGA